VIPLSRGLGRSECRQPTLASITTHKEADSKRPTNLFFFFEKTIFCDLKTFEYAIRVEATKLKTHDKGEYVTSYHIHVPNT